MYNIKISVLILTYNSSMYIREALDSILNQDLNCELEIVIGDDASQDDTANILQDYKGNNPDIITLVVNDVNKGLIRNYFDTLKLCTGKYIMVCAGDDYWLPGKIVKQVEYMESHQDVYAVFSNTNKFYEENGKMVVSSNKSQVLTFKKLLHGNSIVALTQCLRKEAVNEYIKNVDPVNRGWLMEDYPMWLWMIKNGKIGYMNDVLTVYRVRNGSISHEVQLDKHVKFVNSCNEIRQYFAGSDEELKAIADSAYYRDLADVYYQADDMKQYRKYIKNVAGLKHKIKYYLSYAPFCKKLISICRGIIKK